MVKAGFGWKDFGSWQAVYEVLPKDKNGNAIKGGPSIFASRDNLVYLDNSKKKVLVMGLKNIFFIDTKDYSLLINRAHINSLKSALKNL